MTNYLIAVALALVSHLAIATEAIHPPTGLSRAFTVMFTVPKFFERPIIEGTTNLPDGTGLIVSLQTPVPACRPNCRMWESKSIVKNGQFIAGPFGVDPGIYTLEITTSMAELESGEVRAIIGARGENLRGPYVKPELVPGAGSTIDYISQITILVKVLEDWENKK